MSLVLIVLPSSSKYRDCGADSRTPHPVNAVVAILPAAAREARNSRRLFKWAESTARLWLVITIQSAEVRNFAYGSGPKILQSNALMSIVPVATTDISAPIIPSGITNSKVCAAHFGVSGDWLNVLIHGAFSLRT